MHSVALMILQRIAIGILSLFVVAFLVLVGVDLLPGDFGSAVLGSSATPEALAAFRTQLGLDHPIHHRYVSWVGAALKGDFGNSFSGRPVSAVIVPRLFNTLKLAVFTALVSVPLAVSLGIVTALYQNRFSDRVMSGVALALTSIPHFLVAYLVMLLLAVRVHWFPSISTIRDGMSFAEQIYRMSLPVLTLTLIVFAYMMRNTRAAIVSVLTSPFIEMARLKGLSTSRIVLRHAMPTALGPIANVIAISLAYLISGVVVIEVVFVYPGVGQTMIDAVQSRDIPVIQACTMIFSAAYIILNLFADVISIVSNPRIMYSTRA